MATYAVAAGEGGAWEKTLVASTVDTVTLADDPERITVINEGVVGIYFSVDGRTPTVGGVANVYAPPNAVTTHPADESSAGVTVKLISSGTPKYSVSGIY